MQATRVGLPTFEGPTLVAWMTHMTLLPLDSQTSHMGSMSIFRRNLAIYAVNMKTSLIHTNLQTCKHFGEW
jgi:hypothetical protein